MILDDLPFHIGATEKAGNPSGLPDTWSFTLYFDPQRVAIIQQVTPELLEILDQAYRAGQLIGTPLAEDSYGKPYADDFLNFISQAEVPLGAKAIEIGAGVGYLTRRLNEAGWSAIGIEPGLGYAAHWAKNGVEIVNDFFPTARVAGKFDLICSYAVLEHITEPVQFLKDVRDHLTPDGVAIFSVPDCTDEIVAGDPAILFHEHFSYFEAGSLARLIESVGMHTVVMKSGFGRCLYAVASLKERRALQGERGLERALVASYPERCQLFIERVRGRLADMAATGTLGVYCAARGLPLLDPKQAVRFFDDDPALHGKFLPPFPVAISGREELFAKLVDHLVIMSRTFGHRICDSLRQQGYQGSIVTLDEM
jgi:2-polyprenyl-3-methyl-5-hydroxy-6-metoxy-1,4-benzoquinol methylase